MKRAISIAAGLSALVMVATLAFALFGPGPTGWEAQTARDPATDEAIFDFRLRASDGESLLSLGCRPNERIGAVVTTDRPPGPAGGLRPARLRLDDGPSFERQVAVDGAMIRLTEPDDPRAPDFISRLASSRRLDIALAAPAGGDGFAAVFQTVGADDVVSDLRRTCI